MILHWTISLATYRKMILLTRKSISGRQVSFQDLLQKKVSFQDYELLLSFPGQAVFTHLCLASQDTYL